MDEQRDGLRQREYKKKPRERNACVNEERVVMWRDGERSRAFLILSTFLSSCLAP